MKVDLTIIGVLEVTHFEVVSHIDIRTSENRLYVKINDMGRPISPKMSNESLKEAFNDILLYIHEDGKLPSLPTDTQSNRPSLSQKLFQQNIKELKRVFLQLQTKHRDISVEEIS